MTQYVLGFLFNKDRSTVLALEKQKPDWQRGRYNAIGGHIEPGETPEQAMERDAYEEADLTRMRIGSWCKFAMLRFGNDELHCFRAVAPYPHLLSKDGGPAATRTDEKLIELDVAFALQRAYRTISNVPWLLAMAFDDNDNRPVVFDITYDFGAK